MIGTSIPKELSSYPMYYVMLFPLLQHPNILLFHSHDETMLMKYDVFIVVGGGGGGGGGGGVGVVEKLQSKLHFHSYAI